MEDPNKDIFEKIKEHIASYNYRARLGCKPQFAVSILLQGNKLQVCRSRKYLKPNNKRAKRELQHAGGTIEENETPTQAGLRELKEETWNDLPDDIKKEYQFPPLSYTQQLYFGGETIIFIHKVSMQHKLYEGAIPMPENPKQGSGEIEHISLIPIDKVYESLKTGYDGVKWRRCSVWSLKRLKYILDLYAQIEI